MNRFFKSAAFPILIVILLAFVTQKLVESSSGGGQKYNFTSLLQQIDDKQVKTATIKTKDQEVSVQLNNGQKYTVGYPDDYGALLTNRLSDHGIQFDVKGRGGSAWWGFLITLAPFALFFIFWIFLMNQMQGGGSKVMSFGKSRAKRMSVDSPKITFKDVAGADEAVEELHEIKEFLENPKKFQALGARVPKGVLLYG
ncbi:MAG: cell division protease FtsH, partial [Miltoncostaeaceae bacterium]|nr:cell division protease FtsH [Miltoncostaeaceae bacterium]